MSESSPLAEAAPLASEKFVRVGTSEYRQMKRDVALAYNRAARNYDQVGTRRFRHFGRELADRLDLDPAARVLDMATGRGAILFSLAERLGPKGMIVGFDVACEMAIQTQREVGQRGIKNAVVLQMDADELAFAAEQFDAVTCGFALFFMDFEHVLKGAYQILKPGGSLAVSVNHSPRDPSEYERWKWLFPLLREVMGPGFRPPPAYTAPMRLGTPERLEAVLDNAGFEGIGIEQVEATLYFADEQDWWRHELSQGSRMWSDGMSESASKRYREQAFERLREMKDDRGIRVVDGATFAFATRPEAGRSGARSR